MPTRGAFVMARRVITGTLTYSSQTNRNSAMTRITTALGTFPYQDETTAVGTGVTTSGTTAINISISIDDRDTAFDAAKALYDAAIQTTRHTSGWVSVNRV